MSSNISKKAKYIPFLTQKESEIMNKCTIRFNTPYNAPVVSEKEFGDCRMAMI